MSSPQLESAAASRRTEADVRAIRGRRNLLEASMRSEGTPEAMIARLANDDTAARMLTYEKRTLDLITGMFGPR